MKKQQHNNGHKLVSILDVEYYNDDHDQVWKSLSPLHYDRPTNSDAGLFLCVTLPSHPISYSPARSPPPPALTHSICIAISVQPFLFQFSHKQSRTRWADQIWRNWAVLRSFPGLPPGGGTHMKGQYGYVQQSRLPLFRLSGCSSDPHLQFAPILKTPVF